MNEGISGGGRRPSLASGVGAFGKVLLTTTRASNHTYAVKCLSKAQILSARLQNHVMQERDVMKAGMDALLVRSSSSTPLLFSLDSRGRAFHRR